MIIQFEDILEEGLGKTISYDSGCLMVYFYPKWWEPLLSKIAQEDLYEDEDSETDCHTTILYGFDLENLDRKKLKSDMEKIEPFSVEVLKLSKFENEKYDVLKFDVSSKALIKWNTYFQEHYDYKNDYPDYNSHLTIGYLKKGKADKYITSWNKQIPKMKLRVQEIVFSGNSNKDKIIIPC